MTALILDSIVFHFYLLMININLNRYKMNNFLTTVMGPSELNAKERKFRLVTIVVAVLTWNDPQGMTIPMPYFQSYSLFLLAAGIGFVVLGWIFRLALQIQQENERFI